MAQSLVVDVLQCLSCKFAGVLGYLADDLANVRLRLALLQRCELVCTGFGYFEEGIACHLHNARVFLPHKFEQFPYNSLKKNPVIMQKSRILPHNIHNTRRNDSFVLLPFFILTQL